MRKEEKSNQYAISLGLKNTLNYECKECEKRCLKPVDGLIKKFLNIYQFCDGEINKFVSLLRKEVYQYEYIDSWERFDETSLPDKKSFLQGIESRRYY